MRFSDQVRWSRKWGAISLLLGVFMFGAIYLLAENGRKDLALYLANFCTALVGVAAVLILFGGVMRPLQKSFYHFAFETSETYRGHFLSFPPMRLWLWIDAQGRDRDA